MPDTPLAAARQNMDVMSFLIIGVVMGWVLGSRAAKDAYAAELRRRQDKDKRRIEDH